MWSMISEDFGIYCVTAASLFAFFLLRIYVRGKSYTKSTRCDGKVVVITGGNTGIGKETAIELAARGAKVYIACRSMERGEEARKDIIQKSRNSNVFVRKLNLASFASIREFAQRFKEEEGRLNILINNAGVMAIPFARTEDGLEMQMGVNHFGHFLLTNLLMPVLKAGQPSRIVNVSSLAHRWGKIQKHNLNCEKSYEKVHSYFNSVINTELSRHIGEISFFFSAYFVKPAMYLFNKTPRQGAQTTIYAALDPDLENVSGQYFSDCGLKKVSKQGLDDDMARWLWRISEKWTKLDSKSE